MKLDRNFFKMGSHLESGDNRNFWKDKTIIERLQASFYLNSISFDFDINNPPKMDKTLFSHRKHKDL